MAGGAAAQPGHDENRWCHFKRMAKHEAVSLPKVIFDQIDPEFEIFWLISAKKWGSDGKFTVSFRVENELFGAVFDQKELFWIFFDSPNFKVSQGIALNRSRTTASCQAPCHNIEFAARIWRPPNSKRRRLSVGTKPLAMALTQAWARPRLLAPAFPTITRARQCQPESRRPSPAPVLLSAPPA